MGFQSHTHDRHLNEFHASQLALAHGGKLDDQHLLTILLARHLPHPAATTIANRLLKQFSSLAVIFSSKLDDLLGVKGVSKQIALDLLQINHLLAAISWAMVSKRPIIDCYEKMIDFCAGQFGVSQQEQFHVLFLNKRFELLHHKCLQVGTLDHVTVYPREVLRMALKHSASHLILAHNHPFGQAKPSAADITMTKQLSILAEGLGIGILDHIIFAENSTYSFLKHNIMPRSPGDLLQQLRPSNSKDWD